MRGESGKRYIQTYEIKCVLEVGFNSEQRCWDIWRMSGVNGISGYLGFCRRSKKGAQYLLDVIAKKYNLTEAPTNSEQPSAQEHKIQSIDDTEEEMQLHLTVEEGEKGNA